MTGRCNPSCALRIELRGKGPGNRRRIVKCGAGGSEMYCNLDLYKPKERA